jgi:hypothetical protein
MGTAWALSTGDPADCTGGVPTVDENGLTHLAVDCTFAAPMVTVPVPGPTVTVPGPTFTETTTVTVTAPPSVSTTTVTVTPSPTRPPVTTPPATTPPPTTPPPTTPPATGWPGPTNTGIPAGTVLTPYTGPCTITTATTITGKTITCGVLFIRAAVTIDRSKVNGQVLEDYISSGSITVTDSEVDGGTRQGAAVSNTNVTVIRSNIHGGAASVQCGSNCTVRDSWLHGQYRPSGSDWHLDGFITNGGSNMTLTHNTLACDEMTGGCTADGFLAADFAKVVNVTFDSNLFVASTQVQYCTYGGANRLGSSQITYRNNVFQRGSNRTCGRYGPAIYTEGSTWTGNRWDDGTPL